MPSNVEVTSTSWFTRIKNALTGVVVGFILLIVSVVLLFWNEGRAVKTYQSLAEAQAAVVTVDSASVDPARDGQIVHVQGAVTTAEVPEDTLTGVYAEGALSLTRKVEMYQWIETSESKTEKKLGGGEETVTTYSYAQDWSSTPQDSAKFYNPDGHENPAMPADSTDFTVQDAAIGAYGVAGSQIAGLGTRSVMEFSDEDAAYIGEYLGLDRPMQMANGVLYGGDNPMQPKLGDIRVTYERVDLTDASVVAKQTGDRLEDYTAQNGYTVFLTAAGTVSSEQMFADAREGTAILTWLLRALGLFLMFVGFASILKILSVLGDIIPLVGTVIGWGTGLFSLVATLCLGSIVIALGWFWARPLLSLAIIAVAAAIVFGISYAKRKSAAPATA